MLCSISANGSLLTTWLVITGVALVATGGMSALLFRRSYWRPTFEQWQYKINPTFPTPPMVRREMLQMLKGIAVATIPPTVSLHLLNTGLSQGYCGVGELGVPYLVMSFFVVWIASDFLEWAYHQLGHRARFAWRRHKAHHAFYNPTPFSVIADGPVDQFARALPLLLFPMVMPINMDVLFLTFAVFFYAYGVYLHWGYELAWPDAHHPWLNTSFQHYIHHARGTLRRPHHTGFFLKLWDQLLGSCYEGGCECSRCAREHGERSYEAWQRLDKPDYSPLLEPSFWLRGRTLGATPAASSRPG